MREVEQAIVKWVLLLVYIDSWEYEKPQLGSASSLIA